MKKINEEAYIDNLKTTLDLAKDAYQDSLDRIKNVEAKLNILLVFGAGLLAGLNIILPDSIEEKSIPDVLGAYIAAYHICIESIEKHKRVKNFMFVVAFISLIIAFVLFIAMTLVKVFN